MPDPSVYRLGETAEPLHLSTAPEHRAAVLAMVEQARRSLCIHTRDLDPAVYDAARLETAIKQLIRHSRHAQLRVLVQDTSRAVREGHCLLRLAQHLSSRIQIRIPGPDHRDFNEAFLVADTCGYIRRPAADLYAGVAEFNAPFEARRLLQYFEEVWERADSDPQLRRLFI
jgi:hypothetical protein